MLNNYRDFEKFNEYDKNKILKLESDYIGKYGFSIETLQGIKNNNERIYGYKWDLILLYLDEQFLFKYNSDERIKIINNIVLDMSETNYWGKGIEMIDNVLLTRDYISNTIKNKLFIIVKENNLNISKIRDKLIKEKYRYLDNEVENFILSTMEEHNEKYTEFEQIHDDLLVVQRDVWNVFDKYKILYRKYCENEVIKSSFIKYIKDELLVKPAKYLEELNELTKTVDKYNLSYIEPEINNTIRYIIQELLYDESNLSEIDNVLK